MDVITTAIIAALAAISTDAIKDSYNALKSALEKKFGSDSKVVDAVKELEENPDSKGRQDVLKEEVGKANVNDDKEIVQLAQDLLDKLKSEPEGQQIINQSVSNVKYAATSGTGAASIGNITENPVTENQSQTNTASGNTVSGDLNFSPVQEGVKKLKQ